MCILYEDMEGKPFRDKEEFQTVPGPIALSEAYPFIHKLVCGASVFPPLTKKCLRDNRSHRVERELTYRQLNHKGSSLSAAGTLGKTSFTPPLGKYPARAQYLPLFSHLK